MRSTEFYFYLIFTSYTEYIK